MAENAVYTVHSNVPIARDVLRMRLLGPTGALAAPGQFVNLRLPGFYLRRPFSVCSWEDGAMDIVYKVVGGGTARMSQLGKGTELDALVGLGNGFDVQSAAKGKVLLVGGGVGVPPLYALAKALVAAGCVPQVALGFRSAADVFFTEELQALGCRVHIATEDGSAGTKGFVTALLEEISFDYYCACGPNAMLQSVHALCKAKGAEGQLSFEERMGCGFGACMGCSCETMLGAKRVCVDGPVFFSQEVMFT